MQDLFDRFQQQFTTKEQEIEAGHQVAHAEDADTCGARDEDDGEDEPEQVAKHNDLQHVKVGPARVVKKNQSGVNNQPQSNMEAPGQHHSSQDEQTHASVTAWSAVGNQEVH